MHVWALLYIQLHILWAQQTQKEVGFLLHSAKRLKKPQCFCSIIAAYVLSKLKDRLKVIHKEGEKDGQQSVNF